MPACVVDGTGHEVVVAPRRPMEVLLLQCCLPASASLPATLTTHTHANVVPIGQRERREAPQRDGWLRARVSVCAQQ